MYLIIPLLLFVLIITSKFFLTNWFVINLGSINGRNSITSIPWSWAIIKWNYIWFNSWTYYLSTNGGCWALVYYMIHVTWMVAQQPVLVWKMSRQDCNCLSTWMCTPCADGKGLFWFLSFKYFSYSMPVRQFDLWHYWPPVISSYFTSKWNAVFVLMLSCAFIGIVVTCKKALSINIELKYLGLGGFLKDFVIHS